MRTFVQAVRFVVGMAMVAGGVVLAGPYVSALVVAHSRAHAAPPARAAGERAMPAGHATQPAMQSSHPGAVAGPGMAAPFMGRAEPPPASFMTALDQPAGPSTPPRAGYVPPEPPDALPPFGGHAVANGVAADPGTLDATYRSTLDIPPPPLLDAHAPSPLAVGWSAHDAFGAVPAGDGAGGMPESRAAAGPPPTPDLYSVRDGDDLTGIATRFYGHPGAAEAIWAANRDRLTSPEMLPIGFPLRMPPSWTVPSLQSPHGRHGPAPIEPGPASVASVGHNAHAASADSAPPASRTPRAGWLESAGQPAQPAGPAATPGTAASPFHPVGGMHPVAATLPPGSTAAPATGRPGTVRVGPGDTLASLAQRFYGNPAMAARLWEANRDRIRSPGLIVPGMELRLP